MKQHAPDKHYEIRPPIMYYIKHALNCTSSLGFVSKRGLDTTLNVF
jgi:hypothetical protein